MHSAKQLKLSKYELGHFKKTDNIRNAQLGSTSKLNSYEINVRSIYSVHNLSYIFNTML